NARFSNATSMAVLVADATEVTERTGRTARAMAGSVATENGWTESALRVHAEALEKIIADTAELSSRLHADLQGILTVDTPYGRRQSMDLLVEFRSEIVRAADGGAKSREASGKYLDGMIGFLIQPALSQQAEALRSFNREMANK